MPRDKKPSRYDPDNLPKPGQALDEDESLENPNYHSDTDESDNDEGDGYEGIYENHPSARDQAHRDHDNKKLYSNRTISVSLVSINTAFNHAAESLKILKQGPGVPPPFRHVISDIGIVVKILDTIKPSKYRKSHHSTKPTTADTNIEISVNEDKLKAAYEHIVRACKTFDEMVPVSKELKDIHHILKTIRGVLHGLITSDSHNSHSRHSSHSSHDSHSRHSSK